MNSKRGVWVSAIVLSILNISPLCQATSVYTIDHSPSAGVGSCTLIAFDIENNQFVYRDSVLLPEHGWGGIDIAIDELTNTLFVSFEWGDGWGGNIVEIVDAQTLSHEAITIDGVSNLTALLFDKENRRLLATDRDTNFLHILKWNPVDETLALEETIQLENITYATDLAIHEDTLYVSEYDYWWGETYTEVYLYDLSENFSYLGKLDIGEDVIAIDYNEKDGILYSVSASTTKLSKFTDPNTISKSVGATVLCVAADDETAGRVFLTTYRDGIEMWDTENWTQDPNIPPDPNFTDIYDNSNTDGVYVGNLAGIITAEDYKPDLIDIIKVDDVNDFDCVSPVSDDPNMVYTIGISSIIYDHNDVWVVDYLPREVDFVSASPEDTTYGYDPYTHTYVWYLAGLEGYDPNPPPADPNTFFILNVKVNEWAEPLSTFINEVTVESDISDGSACHETDVCCWTHPDSVSGVIYVDQRAIENAGYIEIGGMEYWWAYGKNTGTCWTDAYRNLQDALDRAGLDCGSIIRVADGTYRPGNDPSEDYFDVPDRTVGYGVEIYGGYAGYGATDPNERDWKRYKTILSGFIGEDDEQYIIRNNTVITMGDNSLLDGFTVEEGRDYGIYGSGDDFSIKNSLVKNNNETGVNCENGELTIQWCQIYDNVRRGINHTGSGKTLIY